jgi:hypothetical protein
LRIHALADLRGVVLLAAALLPFALLPTHDSLALGKRSPLFRAFEDPGAGARASAGGWIEVDLLLDHTPADGEVRALEDAGFFAGRARAGPVRAGALLTGRIRLEDLPRLEAREEVVSIEPARDPFLRSPLDVSALEVGAEFAWAFHPSGMTVSGEGMVIANLDTGVDVFHPLFWRADGDTFSWIDSNENGRFDPGTDHVDVDGDGIADPDETLDFFDGVVEGWSDTSNADGEFRSDVDWLFQDANGNGVRDCGPGAGFTESDPTYGERLFVALDQNTSFSLNPSESLVALGTCKIKAVLEGNGVVRERGVDLIQTEPDTAGHGTSTCGVLAGGVRGLHRYVGIAPEADLVVANLFADNSALECALFARDQEADVMLWEAGTWIARPMDGSEGTAYVMDAFSDSGIVQVAPAGDLGRGDKHAHATLTSPAPSTHVFAIDVPAGPPSPESVWLNLIWRPGPGPDDLDVTLESPSSGPVSLPFDGTWVSAGDFMVNSDVALSPRGTYYTYINFIRWNGSAFLPLEAGTHELSVTATGGSLPADLHVYLADDVSTWSGGVTFGSDRDSTFTVASPGIADSAFTVGSYATRALLEGTVGGLSSFSSRGPRVDGAGALDLAAPGHFDIYSAASSRALPARRGRYAVFGGTSAAAAHVAAGLALVKQVYPASGPAALRAALEESALRDGFTGGSAGEAWGQGKLRIFEALYPSTGIDETVPGARDPILAPNVPNPFNPATEIRFLVPEGGAGSLAVYDLRGARVATLLAGRLEAGPGRVVWDGRDDDGLEAASGVYFMRLEVNGNSAVRKMVLIR